MDSAKQTPGELRKPKFTKLSDVQPGVHGFNAYVKIIELTKTQKTRVEGTNLTVAEGLAGDETGSIRFRVVGQYADTLEKGKVVAWRNGLSEVFQEHHRISIDKFGRITLENVNVDYNVNGKKYSEVAYEKVTRPPREDRRDRERRDDRRERRGDNRREDREDRRDRGERKERREPKQ